MVSFLAGLCDLCGEANALATPEQCKRAGLDVDAAVCVDCLKRANPAASDQPAPAKLKMRKPS